jgi:hypothetical protein
MLKKAASFVLASLRGSTLKRTRRSETLVGLIRSPRSILGVNGHTKCGTYLLASSLAAALLDGLFEQPAVYGEATYG